MFQAPILHVAGCMRSVPRSQQSGERGQAEVRDQAIAQCLGPGAQSVRASIRRDGRGWGLGLTKPTDGGLFLAPLAKRAHAEKLCDYN